MKFKLEIALDNEAMSSPYHVEEALRNIADYLPNGFPDFPEGIIRDINGNVVGKYGTWEE